MIILKTEVAVKGISGKSIYDFMLNSTDKDYQEWWEGTHLAFHTIQRFPNDLGNLVYVDEYVGSRRLKFEGVVIKLIPCKEIVWQMKKVVRMPAWIVLEFKDNKGGVVVAHTLKVGLAGIGRLMDPFIKLYLNKGFENDLEEHAHIEFTKLEEILT